MNHLIIANAGPVGGDECRVFSVEEFEGTLRELLESLFSDNENINYYLGSVRYLDVREDTERENIVEISRGKVKTKMPEFEERLCERVRVTGLYGGWGYYTCNIQFPDLFDYPEVRA